MADQSKNRIQIKRINEEASPADGMRVLIDRIWPRGISKEKAQLTVWMREVTPSTALRTWFKHDPDKLDEFARRYRDELSSPFVQPYLEQLRLWSKDNTVTLLYAAKDEHCNHAIILKQYLEQEG